jgi:hypothetical protein
VSVANLATLDQLAQLRKRPRQQPERKLTDSIKRYAKRGGWLCFHNLRAKGSDHGFLDLTLLRPPRLVLAELKVPPNNRPSDWQQVWLEYRRTLALFAGPHLSIETYVWRPSDWSEIERVLR